MDETRITRGRKVVFERRELVETLRTARPRAYSHERQEIQALRQRASSQSGRVQPLSGSGMSVLTS